MCNAHGHPPGCTCGWGGEGHLGRGGSRGSVTPTLSRIWRTYNSYVNPNAKCPVCGCPVFYYQSPDGGRVFFDELGPPWPKHPCTDNRAGRTTVKPTQSSPPTHYRWQINRWTPFFASSAASYAPELLRVSGMFDGTEVYFYVLKRPLETLMDPRDIVLGSLIHIKRTSEERFLLTMFTPSRHAVEVIGYISSIEAANATSKPRHRQRKLLKRLRSNSRSNGRAASAAVYRRPGKAHRSPKRYA